MQLPNEVRRGRPALVELCLRARGERRAHVALEERRDLHDSQRIPKGVKDDGGRDGRGDATRLVPCLSEATRGRARTGERESSETGAWSGKSSRAPEIGPRGAPKRDRVLDQRDQHRVAHEGNGKLVED